MPCSAEIDPPIRSTIVEYDRVDLVPAREEIRGVAADRLADIVMDVAVAEMAERHRPRARDQFHHGGIGLLR